MAHSPPIPANTVECPHCGGLGRVVVAAGAATRTEPCGVCRGTGRLDFNPAPKPPPAKPEAPDPWPLLGIAALFALFFLFLLL